MTGRAWKGQGGLGRVREIGRRLDLGQLGRHLAHRRRETPCHPSPRTSTSPGASHTGAIGSGKPVT